MRKLTYALAAVAALSIPTIASAQGVGVYIGNGHGHYGDRYDGPRVGVYREHDQGWHHGWYNHHRDYYRDRGVVIRDHDWDD